MGSYIKKTFIIFLFPPGLKRHTVDKLIFLGSILVSFVLSGPHVVYAQYNQQFIPPPSAELVPTYPQDEYDEFRELENLLTSEQYQDEYLRQQTGYSTQTYNTGQEIGGPGQGHLQMKPSANKQPGYRIEVLDLKNMDINDVLKLISQKSGLNIVPDQRVKAKITIYLKEIDVIDALEFILEAYGLAYAQEDGVIRVMMDKDFELRYGYKFGDHIKTRIHPLKHANVIDLLIVLNQMKSPMGKVIADVKSNTLVIMDTLQKIDVMEDFIHRVDVPVETQIFNLNYADAQEITEKIREVLTANLGQIKFDARSNKVIVSDTRLKLEMIHQIIEAFDEKHKEVLIEAKIVQVILSDAFKLGIDWEAIVSDYHKLDLHVDLDALSASDKRGKVSIGTLSSEDYQILLEALETIGKTNILSSPSITVIHNKEAKILVGSTEPYVTTTTTTPTSGPTTTAESVNFIEVGVKLYVTPLIHRDNYVTMKIKPEVSSVTRVLKTSQNNEIPVVETSQAETTVLVKNGVTIVIGGLIKDEKLQTVKKIPFLGDLPIIGMAFRNKDDSSRKTELVIFLTPKIITGDVASRNQLSIRE